MKIIEGDLLEIESGVLIHQVNCCNVTGGLAGALRRKYQKAFEVYDFNCKSPANVIAGMASIGGTGIEGLRVMHIFGQIRPGPNTSLPLVEMAFERAALMLRGDKEIYAPFQIWCGLGGGDWNKYQAIIEKHIPHCVIVKKY